MIRPDKTTDPEYLPSRGIFPLGIAKERRCNKSFFSASSYVPRSDGCVLICTRYLFNSRSGCIAAPGWCEIICELTQSRCENTPKPQPVRNYGYQACLMRKPGAAGEMRG